MSEGPSEFLSEFLLTPRIRPSQLRGDGGMAVLAALMASRRGRTRWGRAAGLRAPRMTKFLLGGVAWQAVVVNDGRIVGVEVVV